MKYIQLFEGKRKYNVGDYVFIDLDYIKKSNNTSWHPEDNYDYFGKIIIKSIRNVNNYPYTIEFTNNIKAPFTEKEILRLLTPNEIEQYELEIQTNKYNL